jgi:hypothetical protein
MAKPYKATNKRIIMRAGNGRFRQATGADLGIGGVCPVCSHFLLRHYDGDLDDRPQDPQKIRYRCFTCEPKTEEDEL